MRSRCRTQTLQIECDVWPLNFMWLKEEYHVRQKVEKDMFACSGQASLNWSKYSTIVPGGKKRSSKLALSASSFTDFLCVRGLAEGPGKCPKCSFLFANFFLMSSNWEYGSSTSPPTAITAKSPGSISSLQSGNVSAIDSYTPCRKEMIALLDALGISFFSIPFCKNRKSIGGTKSPFSIEVRIRWYLWVPASCQPPTDTVNLGKSFSKLDKT